MTESEFVRLADETLARIENAIDGCGADIDCENTGGVLTLTFVNGSQIVVNKQAANREIWLAAKSGGFHFVWTDGEWRDTRDGTPLFAALGKCVGAQAGQTVTLG
ncbi:MAG: iron donor protein CyaY [Sulfuricellaceae bacterium]